MDETIITLGTSTPGISDLPNMSDLVKAKLAELCLWRERAETARVFQAMLIAQLKQENDWKHSDEVKQLSEQERDRLETELHLVTLDAFAVSGDKHPYPALNVREMTQLVYDEAEALKYCRTNMIGALKLDKTKFEKAAVALGLDFVKEIKKPSATIASDLSEFTERVDVNSLKFDGTPDNTQPSSWPSPSFDMVTGKITMILWGLGGKMVELSPVDSPEWQAFKTWIWAEIQKPDSRYDFDLLFNTQRNILAREAEILCAKTDETVDSPII